MGTNSYYSATLYPLQDKVLKVIDALQTPFYLTGGTALSRCYFKHRYSDDLDLFVNNDKNFASLADQVTADLDSKFMLEVVLRSETYYSLNIDKILKIEMVNDVAFRVGDLEKKDIFSKVDSLHNILSNKLSAVISRDEPKDVVDIWVISKNIQVDWPTTFQTVGSKAVGIFPPDVAKRLADFPLQLLDRIKWIEGKKPDKSLFKVELNQICDAMLKVK